MSKISENRSLPPNELTLTYTAVVESIAFTLWEQACSEHEEEHGCGTDEDDPPIPPPVYDLSRGIIRSVEKANGRSIELIYGRAVAAEEARPKNLRNQITDPDRFGACLAYQTTGTGISWFDDHARFDLRTPYFDSKAVRRIRDAICGAGGETSDAGNHEDHDKDIKP